MGSEVYIETRGSTLVVFINRPDRRNAISRPVALAIAKAMDQLDGDTRLRAGILTGHGSTFCAGMDLNAFLRGERPDIEGRGFGGLTEAPPAKPLIAAVEGYALAGGCELALTCDLIVAASNAQFGLPEVTRGLVAGSGGLVRLPAKIPRAIALEYALTGDLMDAETAHGWGLVNRVAPDGEALSVALALADQITDNAPLAVATTKQIVTESPDWPTSEVWATQAPLVEAVLASEDAQEGPRAFAEKREPIWKGR